MSLFSRIGTAIASLFRRAPITAGYLPEPTPTTPPAPAPSSPNIEIVTTASRQDYADSFAGFKLTPERLSQIFRMADLGYPLQMFDVFEHFVLVDGSLRGHWEQRLDEVSAVEWSLRPGDERQGSIDLATELEVAMRAMDTEGLIEHLALQPFVGCSYAEIAWVSRPDGFQIPFETVCVPHRRFVFDELSRPRLTSDANWWPGELLERRAGSSWVKAETRRWRKQVQAGIMRTVAYWSLFKRMSVRDWLIFAEKFGIPMIVGKYDENASETTRKALKEAITALGSEGRAILAHGQFIEVLTDAIRSGGSEHLHQQIVALCNAEISKAITAGTLTSDTGGPGSFALGQVHAAQKHKLHVADARRIGRWIRRDIGFECIVRNGLVAKAAPPFLHLHVQKLDLLNDAKTVETLVRAGMKLSQRYQREHFNQPAPSDDDDELKPPEKNNAAAPPENSSDANAA